MAGLTAMVGFWATLSLNIPDFSRYARSQKDQILGQIFGLPLTMFLFAALGVVMTAASASLVGETVSDPVSLIGHIPAPAGGGGDGVDHRRHPLDQHRGEHRLADQRLQNIAPKLIGRTRAVWLTGFIGLALMAHELLKKLGWIVSDLSLESVYSNWLLGYSSLLGPIAGIMVVDYFLVRRQRLDLAGLYRDDVYPAWNWPGFATFAVPVALTVMALGNRQFHWFYDYGWFTGSLLGGALYGLCGRRARSPAAWQTAALMGIQAAGEPPTPLKPEETTMSTARNVLQSTQRHIDGQRLWQSLMDLARLGATAKGGVCRLALSDLDRQARDLFVQWCEAAGCTVSVDRVGNIFARRPGRNPDLPR